MENKKIWVEVAYAKPDEQVILRILVNANDSIESIIQQSGILQRFPELDLKQGVGVFSEPRLLTDCVNENDRIEIYRELLLDPKEARRERAKKSES